MKTLTCYNCQDTFQAKTKEEMLQKFYNHYMEQHHAVITGANEVEKKRWMVQFETDWEVASVDPGSN